MFFTTYFATQGAHTRVILSGTAPARQATRIRGKLRSPIHRLILGLILDDVEGTIVDHVTAMRTTCLIPSLALAGMVSGSFRLRFLYGKWQGAL